MALTLGPHAYRVRLEPVSPGTLESDSTLVHDPVAHDVKGLGPLGTLKTVVLPRTDDNQAQGLLKYLALIKAGNVDTSSVETAINALL